MVTLQKLIATPLSFSPHSRDAVSEFWSLVTAKPHSPIEPKFILHAQHKEWLEKSPVRQTILTRARALIGSTIWGQRAVQPSTDSKSLPFGHTDYICLSPRATRRLPRHMGPVVIEGIKEDRLYPNSVVGLVTGTLSPQNAKMAIQNRHFITNCSDFAGLCVLSNENLLRAFHEGKHRYSKDPLIIFNMLGYSSSNPVGIFTPGRYEETLKPPPKRNPHYLINKRVLDPYLGPKPGDILMITALKKGVPIDALYSAYSDKSKYELSMFEPLHVVVCSGATEHGELYVIGNSTGTDDLPDTVAEMPIEAIIKSIDSELDILVVWSPLESLREDTII